MKMTRKILIMILLCLPMVAWGDLNEDLTTIGNAKDDTELLNVTNAAFDNAENRYQSVTNRKEIVDSYRNQIGSGSAAAGTDSDGEKSGDEKSGDAKSSEQSPEEKAAAQKKVDDAQAKLDKAKETEQSTANRMLGGLTTLATGIGGMQLAQGIAEKKADSAADKDMDAYIATMRCTYGDGKSVPFSTDPIELPGGNNADLMKYRAEYVALAKDLKERKTALDMKPGIESEEILDKATMGLYDDENTGITSGHYASRYRAAAGSEKDKKGLAADKKEAKNRMIAGGVIAGVGVVGGIVGNSLINGKLGELIKKNKEKKATAADNKKATDKLKSKAKAAGLTAPEYIDSMGLDSYNVGNYIEVIDKAVLRDDIKGQKIADLCPTPQVECADKLLTEKSKQEIVGAVAADSAGAGGLAGGLGGLASGVGGDALKGAAGKLLGGGNSGQEASGEPAAEAPAEETPAE